LWTMKKMKLEQNIEIILLSKNETINY